MGAVAMGKVVVAVKVENLDDVILVKKGSLTADQIRSVSIADALVDTGATGFSLPKSVIEQLGLDPVRVRKARTSAGLRDVQTYSAVRLTVQGRDCICDVAEVPEDCPVLLGQIPLELLDYVVDMTGQRLIGNPDHGGEHMIDMF